MSSVALIVVGTNEKPWLSRAFSTLLSNGYKGRLEIIYVDNASHDGSLDFVKTHFPSVHTLRSLRNLGFSGANNLGIQKALALHVKYVFLLNPDTASPKHLIQRCVEFMEAHPEFGAVGPLQSVYGEPLEMANPPLNEWSQLALQNGERHTFYMHFPGYSLQEEPPFPALKIEHVLEHAYVQGAALLLRTCILGNCPWFDPTYHTYYEEVDLCRRIRWLGYRIGLLTNLFIQHKGGGSTAEGRYRKRLMMRNKYYYILTDPTWNFCQITRLFRGWIARDLQIQSLEDLRTVTENLLWLFLHFPKALYQRGKNKKSAPERFLHIVKEI
jgi:GT2 family glycosyltransferase